MGAIFRREFKSFFVNPIGYIVLAVLFFISGRIFAQYNLEGGLTDLSYLYSTMFTIVMLAAPFLTMRLFSEEKRQKTDQALLTAPTGLTGIVLGKFFAALALFALALSITLVYALVIALKVTPDWSLLLGNYLGLLLVSGMIISIGLFMSSITESQVIAALGTLTVSFVLLLFVDKAASTFSAIDWLSEAISFFSINTRYNNFIVGLVEYDDVLFFISIQALFIFITVRVLDSKRWK